LAIFPTTPHRASCRTSSAHTSQVKAVEIPLDKFSGKSKGFGFVELISESDAQIAIDTLNETQLGGRTIRVNIANPPRLRGTSGAERNEQTSPRGARGIDDYRRDDRTRYSHRVRH
jgi:RNA recognition motif-containing protein